MPEDIISYQELREANLSYDDVLHALNEYKLWRDNVYVGKELGAAREAYLGILKQRARDAIEGYKFAKAHGHEAVHRAA